MRASDHRETADPRDRDDRAEDQDPSAAELIGEPTAEEVSDHRATGAEGEEPHHRRLVEPTVHRVSNLMRRHDLVPDDPECRHRERRPEL